MLTVKHIIWDGGFETLYQAKQIRVKREEPRCAPSPGSENIEFVAFDLPNDDVFTIRDGLVYVMNEVGKTIAKYDFRTASDGSGETPPSRANPTLAPSTTWTA